MHKSNTKIKLKRKRNYFIRPKNIYKEKTKLRDSASKHKKSNQDHFVVSYQCF